MKILFLLLSSLAFSLNLSAGPVRLVETEIEFPTYAFSDPNPVPETSSSLYPYFRFEGSTAKSELRKWKAVILENDKIRVTMLPEIGGKVWGAEDKKTGRAFLYYNHVVKFRNIALRGPWCSGGIEFNFTETGHAPTSATPVDWCVRVNDDGSASYFAASGEYLGPTWWQVEVRLRPDDEFFTMRTTWHNASYLPGAYYQWMNAAFPLQAQTDFVFPGRHYIGHPGDAHAWPRDSDGHALDTYAGNFFGSNKSYHVINGDNGLFGVWWPEWNFGAVHRNPSCDKYGRKIWLWSPARSGAIWADLLTDRDGQYAELQSGRAFQQPRPPCERTPFKIPSFAAGATDFFEESWGVVRSRGDFGDTNGLAAPRPVEMPKNFDWNSPDGLVIEGEQVFRERHDDDDARRLFESALKKNANFIPALNALATLECRRGHYDRAIRLADRALSVDTYDPTANYLCGFAALETDDLATARERLGLASYSPSLRASAYTLLARLALRERNSEEALRLAERALESNVRSPDARHLKIMALRLAGRADAARIEARRALEELPLFHPIRYELSLLGEGDFRAFIRGELPDETAQDIAERYIAVGQTKDACRILATAAASPLAAIQSAFLEKNVSALAHIADLPTSFAFPFRTSMRSALAWAAANHASWKFKWYLALYLAANGEGDRADALLASCGEEPEDPVFYLYRASRKLGAAKRPDLHRAAARGDAGRALLALAKLDAAKGDYASALANAERALKERPESNEAKLVYARALMNEGRFRECVAFLEKATILPSEHGENANDIWRTACYALGENAKAESYPENLGAGRPYPQDKRPYEFQDADRTEDDAPALEDFERDVAWTATAVNGAALVERTCEEQLFGTYTLRLSYRGCESATNAACAFGPAKPLRLPTHFDTMYVWVKGNHFGCGSNHEWDVPTPELAARFRTTDGTCTNVALGPVRWPDWHQVNFRFSKEVRAKLNGGEFLGFTLTGGTQRSFRQLHFDDLTFLVDDVSKSTGSGATPISVRPRAKRPLVPLKGAELGVNTGAGTLPFPTREETIIPETDNSEKGDLVPVFNGGAGDGDVASALEITRHRSGRSLVVDFYAPAGQVKTVTAGTASEARILKSFTVPYLAYGRGGNRLRIDLLEGGWYRSAVFDWYRSNASDVRNEKGMFAMRYLPKTDGSYNPVSERLVITLSRRFEDVLPVIANPASPYRVLTGSNAWRAHGAFDFRQDAAFWKRIHDAGIRHVVINDHETLFRDRGESFTYRTSAAPGRGGDAAAAWYSRFLHGELGYAYGPYNNFTDFSPMNAYWRRDRVSRASDGSFQSAWFRCYAPKPILAPEFCEQIAPQLAERFGYDTAYCDVHTALSPFQRTDYDARVPGAGTFAQTFYAWGDLLLAQKRAWKGPVYSEGGAHFFYSGLTDGNYAQDQEYDFMKNPWIVDFDLRRIHPLECNFGMGLLAMFSPPKTPEEFRKYQPHCENRERFIDLFLTATAAFGHAPYLILDDCFSTPRPFGLAYLGPGEYDVEKGLPLALRSYALLQPIAARYTQARVKTIRYFDAEGRALETSEAIANGVVARNQIAVEYDDGTFVVANGNRDCRLSGTFGGERFALPPCAFKAWTADKSIFAEITEDAQGRRHAYSRCPEFVFEDGRISFQSFHPPQRADF